MMHAYVDGNCCATWLPRCTRNNRLIRMKGDGVRGQVKSKMVYKQAGIDLFSLTYWSPTVISLNANKSSSHRRRQPLFEAKTHTS